jgi:hypothetical protein
MLYSPDEFTPFLPGLEKWIMETKYRTKPAINKQSPGILKGPFRLIFKKNGIIKSRKVVSIFTQ